MNNVVPGGGRIGAAAKTGGGGGMAKIDLIHTYLGILKCRNISTKKIKVA